MLTELRAMFGSCYACGDPALSVASFEPRACEDCGRELCDTAYNGKDCGPTTPAGAVDVPLCWDCHHAREGAA